MERIQAAIEKAKALREGQPSNAEGEKPHAKPVRLESQAENGAAPKHVAEETRQKSAQKRPDGKAKTRAPRVTVGVEHASRLELSAPQIAARDDAGSSVPRPRTAPRAPRFHISPQFPVWQDLRPFKPDPALMRKHRIVSYERTDPAHVAYDMMRTRLLRVLRENGWTSVAITSPSANCGKTTTTLNLAFALAYQQDTRTVVMDVDLRRPQMAKVLGLNEVHSMARILDGTGRLEENFVRYGETLALGTNERPSRHPSELLQHKAAAKALADMKAQMNPDVILYDMPPMMSNDDVMAFLPHVDCALLIAAAESTTIDEVDRCERELGEQTNVLGVVLNKCRYTNEKYGYY